MAVDAPPMKAKADVGSLPAAYKMAPRKAMAMGHGGFGNFGVGPQVRPVTPSGGPPGSDHFRRDGKA